MEPVILDIFTTPKDSSQRKKVFSPGESIQWNVIHTARDGDFLGRQARVYWYIQHWALTSATWEDPKCDALFRSVVVVKHDFTYSSDVQHSWWWSTSIAPFSADISIPYDGRKQTLLKVGGRDVDLMMYLPGFWKFSAYVRMTDPETGSPFDTMGDWD